MSVGRTINFPLTEHTEGTMWTSEEEKEEEEEEEEGEKEDKKTVTLCLMRFNGLGRRWPPKNTIMAIN
jgi:hypothetical protein